MRRALLDLLNLPELVSADRLLPDLQNRPHRAAHADGVHAPSASPLGPQTDLALVVGFHRPHLGGAAHVLPQMEPGAVGGARHHQVHQFAAGPVPDAVHAVPHPVKGPLLFGIMVIFAQTDVRAVFSVFHRLDHAAGSADDGIIAAGLDHGLFHGFHVVPSLPCLTSQSVLQRISQIIPLCVISLKRSGFPLSDYTETRFLRGAFSPSFRRKKRLSSAERRSCAMYNFNLFSDAFCRSGTPCPPGSAGGWSGAYR